jgi:hypothetical protein
MVSPLCSADEKEKIVSVLFGAADIPVQTESIAD